MIDLKSEKAITLAVLISTVIVLLILATVAIYSVKSSKNVAPYNKMVADIELLHDKILDYYSKNGVIPKKNETETLIDGKQYYEIDLQRLENITLNYGLKNDSNDDVYLIDNELNIYYKEGVELDGQIYHVKNNTQDDNEDNDTSWIILDFAKKGLIDNERTISDETLNKLNNLSKRFTSYNANGQTYNLTKKEVLDFLTVFYDENDEEYIVYRYGPIFWSTHVYGEGEESYNRRAAIFNYLNEQEEITGMLGGDINENGKIDMPDVKYLEYYCSGIYEGYSSIPKQEEYDDNFRWAYLAIVGDADNSYYADASDLATIEYYLTNYFDSIYIEDMIAKYYIESDDGYWLEEELMQY